MHQQLTKVTVDAAKFFLVSQTLLAHGRTVTCVQMQLILFIVVLETVHAIQLAFVLLSTRLNGKHSSPPTTTVGAMVSVVLEMLQSAVTANGMAWHFPIACFPLVDFSAAAAKALAVAPLVPARLSTT